MQEKFLVFDNIISEYYLKHLVNNIFDYNWKYFQNLTFGNSVDQINQSDFEHGFNADLTEEQKNFILPLILKICSLSNLKISNLNQIIRITPRIQTQLSPNNEINDIHIDRKENHYVIIFYPHNIDGETLLYNQTTSDLSYSKFIKMNQDEKKTLSKSFTILEKIMPRENRAVVFKGNRYHASSSPSKGPRCIINVNIIPDFEEDIKNLTYQ